MAVCPQCYNRRTIELYFGKPIPEIMKAEKEGKIKYGGLFPGENPAPDHHCPKCGFKFTFWELNEDFTEKELEEYYIKYRSKYKTDLVKYLIISEAPTEIYEGCTPPFFYNNPNGIDKNSLFNEVATVLFYPPEYVEKTRDMKVVYPDMEMYKFLDKMKAKGFFQIDMLDMPAGFYKTSRMTASKHQKVVAEKMKKNLKSKLLLINQVCNPDTVIFLVKKTTYELLYPELSVKYKIANDILEKEFGKPYLPSPTGHQKEFRTKFKQCLEAFGYEFETDFSDALLR